MGTLARTLSGWRDRARGRSAPPPVSVVINTLNRRDHLRRTLLALREQTYERFEVIVVNGPSADGTDEMLREFRDTARLADCPQASLGPSRNIGAAAAAGEIVAFIDDDAIPRGDWLQALAAPYADPAVGAVGGPVFDVPLDTVAWKLCTCTRLGVPDTDSPGPAERYAGPGADPLVYLPGCNMSFRRRALQTAGGFNQLLSYNYDDVEICSRVMEGGHRIDVVDEVLVRHERAANVTRPGPDGLLDPYPALFCRSVFALQAGSSSRSREEIAAVLRAAGEEMVGLADRLHADGSLDPAGRATFTRRARQSVEDGLAAGSRARPVAALPNAAPGDFRPYR